MCVLCPRACKSPCVCVLCPCACKSLLYVRFLLRDVLGSINEAIVLLLRSIRGTNSGVVRVRVRYVYSFKDEHHVSINIRGCKAYVNAR